MAAQPNYEALRERMVREQLIGRGIRDPRVLAAMRRVPRHEFVPPNLRDRAYEDSPLPIGGGQTISQPYIVAYMTQALALRPQDVVLEIGTGSGYQTAILAELAKRVYSLERRPELSTRARAVLERLGYHNVQLHIGDGTQGLPEFAPYDAILVTAAAPSIPVPLQEQLADGGRLVLPIGEQRQQLLQRIRRQGDRLTVEDLIAVVFVPLYGEHGFAPPRS